MSLEENPEGQSAAASEKRKYDSCWVKGVWNPDAKSDENLDIRIYDFSEEPDSPKPDGDDPFVLLGPVEPGEPSQPRLKVEALPPPLSKEEKRTLRLKEKDEKREARRLELLALERKEREILEASREAHRQADIAAQNERAERMEAQRLADIAAQNERAQRMEAALFSSQSETRQSFSKMEMLVFRLGSMIESHMPMPIASFNPDQPLLSICGAATPAQPLPLDSRACQIPATVTVSSVLPLPEVRPPSDPPTLWDSRPVQEAPTQGPLDSGDYPLDAPDERNDAVDYDSEYLPPQENLGASAHEEALEASREELESDPAGMNPAESADVGAANTASTNSKVSIVSLSLYLSDDSSSSPLWFLAFVL